MTIQPIETHYKGCRFRSRLEARWAVFFDALEIPWQYEPQGFRINGRPYLPDFLLPESGTWIEVKGDERDLDKDLMRAASKQLPRLPVKDEDAEGPRLMILGDIPEPVDDGDWGWTALGGDWYGEDEGCGGWPFGFAWYHKFSRPYAFFGAEGWPDGLTPSCRASGSWLKPAFSYECGNGAPGAFRAARSARFEHDEAGTRKSR